MPLSLGYAITFWPGGDHKWLWTPLSYQQWLTVGRPSPRNAGWIKDSHYDQWGTSSEIFVEGADGVNHKLSNQEWADSGFRGYVQRSKRTVPQAQLGTQSSPACRTSASEQTVPWVTPSGRKKPFPPHGPCSGSPVTRSTRTAGSTTIWYAGPEMNRPLSLN